MAMGGGFPVNSVPALRMQNAASPKHYKLLVLGRIQGALSLAAAETEMRRLLGSCGSAARQDTLVAADANSSSAEKNDLAAWLAYRKATKKNFARKEKGGRRKEEKAKIKVEAMARP